MFHSYQRKTDRSVLSEETIEEAVKNIILQIKKHFFSL